MLAIPLDDFQPVTLAFKKVGFPGGHVTFALPRLIGKITLLSPNPGQTGGNSSPNPVLGNMEGNGNPDTAVWRQYTEVQVLDVLVDNFHLNAADLDA